MQRTAVIRVPYITTSAVSQQSTSVIKWWILLQSHRVRHSRPLPFKLMKTNCACNRDRERGLKSRIYHYRAWRNIQWMTIQVLMIMSFKWTPISVLIVEIMILKATVMTKFKQFIWKSLAGKKCVKLNICVCAAHTLVNAGVHVWYLYCDN